MMDMILVAENYKTIIMSALFKQACFKNLKNISHYVTNSVHKSALLVQSEINEICFLEN